MGVLCKIFVAFDKPFWDEKEYILIAKDKPESSFPYWKPIYSQNGTPTNILMTIVSGDMARKVEKMDQNKLKDELQYTLFDIYGGQFCNKMELQ
jgi:monoamine oxidase